MSLPEISPRTFRTLLAAAVVALAMHFTQSQDYLKDYTKPVVIGILQLCGLQANDLGASLNIGSLNVPWTRDCAGVNLLLIMLALAIWVNRQEPAGPKFWIRIACMLPAALAANVLRVLTLIAYRQVAAPSVESPQTHYFMGLVWIVPFITLVTPRAGRPASQALLETLHAAAVVALLAPMTGMPNGSLITLAAVFALTQSEFRPDRPALRGWLTAAWILAGAGIAAVNMESFWLPWLLVCPLFLDFRWAFSLTGITVLLSSHAIFAMQSWAVPVAGTALALAWFGPAWLRQTPSSPDAEPSPAVSGSSRCRPALAAACVLGFILPFTASTLLSAGQEKWAPAASVQSRPIQSDGFEVLLPGQSNRIALACYGPPGRDRHHTIKVCLKYRGIDVIPTESDTHIFTDGKHWLAEYFYQDGNLISTYASYLQRTFRPGSDPGVHLIFISPMEKMTQAAFATEARELARTFHHLHQPEASPGGTPAFVAQLP